MSFDAREAMSADPEEYPPFEFVGLDGETYRLPDPLTLTERQADRINRGDIKPLIAEIAPEAYEAVQDMPIHVSQQLAKAWLGQAGEPGKSPSPSSATNRAARRSKRTSPPGAST